MLHLAVSLSQFLGHDLWHWNNGIGYQWWSGIGSVFTIKDLVYILVLWRIYRNLHQHWECHAEDCRKLGFHHVEGTNFRTCWIHHPVLRSHLHRHVPLRVIHQAHTESTSGAVKTKEGNK